MIVGAVTGTAALIWGVWQFVLAGPRITAEIEEGRLAQWGQALISGGPAWAMRDPEYPHPVVVVRARNKGRSPVDISRIGVELEKIVFNQIHGLADSPELPHRIEPGSVATWLMDLRDVSAAVYASSKTLGGGQSARARVELATAKVVTSGKDLRIPLPPEA